MEIKINIPANDYVQQKEVRENVVQAICTTFLEDHVNTTFHPFSENCYRRATLYVATKHPRGGFLDSSWADKHKDDGYVRINGEEMKTAFEILRKAGYHIFRIYEYGSWMGYECSKKPFMQKGTEVTEFTDFID
jgi:hypothetical protein